MKYAPFLLFLAGTSALLALETPRKKDTSANPLPSATPAISAAVATPARKEIPPDTGSFTNDPKGGGIEVGDIDELLTPYTSFTISFPAGMVTPDRIDTLEAQSPIAVWPATDTEFYWRTESMGDLVIKGPLIPGQNYRFRLRQDLTDAGGNPIPDDVWGFEVSTPPLNVVEDDYGERDNLNSRPQVPLSFSYPMDISTAPQYIWMQDRTSRERYPVEILLNTPEGELTSDEAVDTKYEPGEVTRFRVRPLAPLPVGRKIDLVVDGVTDLVGGKTLSYPRVFPLGKTSPLSVEYVAARNFPLEKPAVVVKFRQPLSSDPLPKDAVIITPAVPNLRLINEGSSIRAEGDFDPAISYKVDIATSFSGAGGYALAKAESWKANFRPKHAAIVFPARQIRQRSALGLSFAFYQVNTSELEWKLAPIPLDKLRKALDREQEFDDYITNPQGDPLWNEDGTFIRKTSEPLIPALGLTAIATGSIPADDGKETLREITWKPGQPAELTGPMLLEVTGKDKKGRTIGNRAIIYFGDTVLTRKVTPTQNIIRVASMKTGEPLSGQEVNVLNDKLNKLVSATSNKEGLATFERVQIGDAAYFQAGNTLQPLKLSSEFTSGYPGSRQPEPLRGFTFTDRPLYRPGQSVQFKGMIRTDKGGILEIPAGTVVKWTIERGYGNEVFASGETKVDAAGGWNGSWTPPESGPLGDFIVKPSINGQQPGHPGRFQIEEFRNPTFSVVCNESEKSTPGISSIDVDSQYFHGAPNVGARVRWTATWISDSDGDYYEGDDAMKRVDLYSENSPRPSYLAEVSGESALDANGEAVLTCKAPFKDPGNRAYSRVSWKVDITGPDGQTITGGISTSVPMDSVLLGVKQGEHQPGQLEFIWDAIEEGGPKPEAVDVKLFRVQTKAVRERLAPNVYRYRNFDQYELVEKRDAVRDQSLKFTPAKAGRYVAVISPLSGQPGLTISEEGYVAGPDESEVPVASDSSAEVFSITGKTDAEYRPWNVGQTATLNVLSPANGIAWVSVETDRILDTFTIPLQGNTSQIEIPIKPEYEPNVFVSVYLLRPGGDDKLAEERFGFTGLSVQSPSRDLTISVKTERAEYEPREKISGEVTVTANGLPVANADLAIYAVDDSILTLGSWKLPEMTSDFFPARNFAISTWTALQAYVDKIDPSWLTMKGFVAGDGGDDAFGNVKFTRKEFKPLILWRPSVSTNAQGVAKFDCEAPDNLTRFRVIAVGQTKASQFGAGDTTFAVAKKLTIEPALPRFVREGDEVELRAVVRQKFADKAGLNVRCAVGGNLELLSPPRQEITGDRNAPVVVRFKARAKSVGTATAKFEVVPADSSPLADSVEVVVPVAYPVVLKKESVVGTVGNTSFAVREVAPGQWENTSGTFSFAASSTPWLSQLSGLPYLLDYPHGCFEQKSSKLLAYTYLASLLPYLPDAQARKANYETVILNLFKEFKTSLLPDGRLPYWPNGTDGNDFVTIQAAWCAGQALAAGFDLPEDLASELFDVMDKMATGSGRTNLSYSLRAFALFVRTTFEAEEADGLAAAANELYLHRDKLTTEGRALLALAMYQLDLEPDKQRQIVADLPTTFDNIAFNAETFSSATRTEALCLWARMAILPEDETDKEEERLKELMETAPSLSTQENLWLLMVFDALLEAKPAAKLSGVSPKPSTVSTNGSAVAWTGQDVAKLATFVAKGVKPGGSYILSAAYRSPETQTKLVSQGMKIERVVKNLTEPSRTGIAEAPFKIGDQVLISYRFNSDKPQSFVALEDMLPAGLEMVNPSLALFGQYYEVPSVAGVPFADLSHSEMRDQQTNLYFDALSDGVSSYTVLARATAAGTFIWPATQIAPMYDSRYFGRSASSVCVVSGE